MATALWILFWIVAALAAAILVVVVTPTVFLLDAAFGGGARARVSVRPLGGLAPAIPVFDSAAARPASRTTAKKRKKKAGGRERPGRSGGAGRARRVVAALPDLVGGVIGTVHVERLALDLDFGTGDPADTGALYGALAPFLYGSWPRCTETVDLRPDFTRARLDGTASARVRFTPAALLPPAVRFGWAAFGPSR